MRIDISDLDLIAHEIISSGALEVDDTREIWRAEPHGVALGVAFDNERDNWLMRGQGWSLSFHFEFGLSTQDIEAVSPGPDRAKFGVWGTVTELAFHGDPSAYARDVTLLKVALPREREPAPSRVFEVEPTDAAT